MSDDIKATQMLTFSGKPCPWCGHPIEAVSKVHLDAERTAEPADGDFMICFSCTQPVVLVVGPFGYSVRLPDRTEVETFHQRFGDIQAQVLQYRINAVTED